MGRSASEGSDDRRHGYLGEASPRSWRGGSRCHGALPAGSRRKRASGCAPRSAICAIALRSGALSAGHAGHMAAMVQKWSRERADFDRVNVEGTEAVLAAASRPACAGSSHTSSIVALGPTAGGPADESSPRTTDRFCTDTRRTKWLGLRLSVRAPRRASQSSSSIPAWSMGRVRRPRESPARHAVGFHPEASALPPGPRRPEDLLRPHRGCRAQAPAGPRAREGRTGLHPRQERTRPRTTFSPCSTRCDRSGVAATHGAVLAGETLGSLLVLAARLTAGRLP